MTDSATSRYGARQQSQGSNTNSWGDDKLNEVLRLFDRGSKGVATIAMTGDQTLTWTNYGATNIGQCAVMLLTGSLSAAAALTVPSVEWVWNLIKNSTGQTITVKTAAGSGVAIANGKWMKVYCDGVDCYNGTGTVLPGAATVNGALIVAGIISGVTAGVASTDATNLAQVQTAIATASLPASAGTVLNTLNDTTGGYLASKLTIAFSTATTTQLSGLTSVQLLTVHGGGVEQTEILVGQGYVGGFLNGGSKTGDWTPTQGTAYDVDCTAAQSSVQLGGMTSVQLGQEIKLNKFGNYPMFLIGTVNGVTNAVITPASNQAYRYCGSSWGWN